MTTASRPAGGPSGEENTPDITPQLDAARREGAAAERTRVQAILDSEEAKDRDVLARALAFESDMTPEAAKALLMKAEKKAPPAQEKPGTGFEAAMRQAGNPDVGADAGASDPDDPVAAANAIVAAYKSVNGSNARN